MNYEVCDKKKFKIFKGKIYSHTPWCSLRLYTGAPWDKMNPKFRDFF
jgi:hypothetical protein